MRNIGKKLGPPVTFDLVPVNSVSSPVCVCQLLSSKIHTGPLPSLKLICTLGASFKLCGGRLALLPLARLASLQNVYWEERWGEGIFRELGMDTYALLYLK